MILGAETSTSSTTTAWATLAGALFGGLHTGTFALVTAIYNQRRQTRTADVQRAEERIKQLRVERRQAYAQYAEAEATYFWWLQALSLKTLPKESSAEPHENTLARMRGAWEGAFDQMWVLGGDAVREAADRRYWALRRRLPAVENGAEPFVTLENDPDVANTYTDLKEAIRRELSLVTEPN